MVVSTTLFQERSREQRDRAFKGEAQNELIRRRIASGSTE